MIHLRRTFCLVLALSACSSTSSPDVTPLDAKSDTGLDAISSDLADGSQETLSDALDVTTQDQFEVLVPAKPEGQPWDLVPLARLSSSSPRPLAPMPWPRETETAVATVRDGHDATAFVPVAGPAWIELDVGPWVGHPIWFDTLSLIWDGAPATEVNVTLLAYDGVRTTPVDVPGGVGPVSVDSVAAWSVRVAFVADSGTRLAGVTLTTRHDDLPLPLSAPTLAELPAKKLEGSGIVEGFYGIPWSWRERHNMVLSLARSGYDTYLYAPKNDPLHRMQWRDSYSELDMERFSQLAQFARSVGVRLVFGISPFVDFGPDTEQDQQVLAAKVTQFMEAGFAGFAILADDIEMEGDFVVDQTLGIQHTEVTNKLTEELLPLYPDLEVWFCPTAYSDERWKQWPQATQYLTAVGNLDPMVRVLWTGPDTFSATLQFSDLLPINEVVQRTVAIWDNYWASDGGDGFTGRLPMAVFADRNADVASLAILNNPAILGSATRMPVTTAALFQAAPSSSRTQMIEYAVQLESALNFGVGNGAEADTLAWLFDLFDAATNGHPGWADLTKDMASIEQHLGSQGTADPQVALRLMQNLGRASVVWTQVYHSALDPDLVDDLYWPLQQVQATARTALLVMDLIGVRLSGSAGASAKSAVLDSIGLMAKNRYEFCSGKMDSFFASAKSLSPTNAGFVVPAESGETPPACRVGQHWSWKPYETCQYFGVFGHPAAKAGDDEIVSFIAPWPGIYELSVVCWQDQPLGWSHQILTLECRL